MRHDRRLLVLKAQPLASAGTRSTRLRVKCVAARPVEEKGAQPLASVDRADARFWQRDSVA